MGQPMKIVRQSLEFLAQTEFFFYTLLWLMYLVVAGTLAQPAIGLYQAQHQYFNSVFLWIGPFPLPGGYLTLGFVFLNLLANLIVKTRWTWDRTGIIVTHFGALLLLIGSLLTALWSSEGSMMIPEGASSNVVADYHAVELAVLKVAPDGSKSTVATFPAAELSSGRHVTAPQLPFQFEVVNFFRNTGMVRWTPPAMETYHGFAKMFQLMDQPLNPQDERNQAGVVMRIAGAGGNDGVYAVFENMPIEQTLYADSTSYVLQMRHVETVLPFSIELIDFEKQMYPGTGMAKSYKSVVILRDGEMEQRSVIHMNHPLRYKGYTFYQSSFIEGGPAETTVLAAVRNAGRLFPYISSLVMCIGLLLHLLIQVPRLIQRRNNGESLPSRRATRTMMMSLLFALLLLPNLGWSKTGPVDASVLAEIPILHQGRVKPLDTFARTQLLAAYGRRSLKEMTALEWLTELIFQPEMAYHRPVFKMRNPDLVAALSLPDRESHLYTFAEVSKSFDAMGPMLHHLHMQQREDLPPAQKQMLDLYFQTMDYFDVSRSLTFLLPQFTIRNPELAQQLHLQTNTPYTYLDMLQARDALVEAAKPLEKKKPDTLNDQELELLTLAQMMQQIGSDNHAELFRIIPPQWAQSGDEWFSPWAANREGQGSVQSAAYVELWRQLANAYWGRQPQQWEATAKTIATQSHAFPKVRPSMLRLEVRYNHWDLFSKSLMFDILAFLLLATSWVFWTRPLQRAAFGALLISGVFHLTGIVLRIVIMGRPPVSTLYESIIFVGFIGMLFGVILEFVRRNGLGILIASVAGMVLHFIALGYADDGDTMGQLVAVLNTNFWLATHVVTITIGYGCCLVAGVLGHAYLLLRAMRPQQQEQLGSMYQNMLGISLFALFFALFGTILGGIWADQSWGRFWGWDPKENGALLIVLWLLWMLHGRLAKIVTPLDYALGMVGTNIIVALAWFGVNLLNVGLHSYGFTDSIAMNLMLFCGSEIMFGLGLYTWIRLREAGFHIARGATPHG